MAPRWEYRVWGEDLSELRAKMAALEHSLGVRISHETYLVGSPDTNAKIRAEILDVKRLLKTDRAFQLWTPTLKEPFPLVAATVHEVLAIVLGSDSPRLEVSPFEMAGFLAQAQKAGVVLVEVSKKRDGYRHEGCLLESAEVTVGGSTLFTVAIESEDLETAGYLAARLGISTLPNQSYPMAIRDALHI